MPGTEVSEREDKLPGSPEPLKNCCAAKLRRSEVKYGEVRYCAQHPIEGRNRCRLHGGLSPEGPASPNWIDGRTSKYSRWVSEEFRAMMDEARNEGDPASLVDEIDLLKGRVAQLVREGFEGLSRIDVETIAAGLVNIRTTLELAMTSEPPGLDEARVEELHQEVSELEERLEDAAGFHRNMDEILKTAEQVRKLASTDTQRAYLRSKTLSREDLQHLLAMIRRGIEEAFPDGEVLTRVTGKEVKRQIWTVLLRVLNTGSP